MRSELPDSVDKTVDRSVKFALEPLTDIVQLHVCMLKNASLSPGLLPMGAEKVRFLQYYQHNLFTKVSLQEPEECLFSFQCFAKQFYIKTFAA